MIRSVGTAEHYVWGDTCDGWFLVRSAERTVIQERVPPGASEARHSHAVAWQFFFVLSGEAILEVDGHDHRLQAHEGIEVPPGTPHQLRNESSADLHFLVISQPNSHGDRVAA